MAKTKTPIGDQPNRLFFGYARVSTQGQELEQQRLVLSKAGCARIFEEKVSGTKRERPELVRLLEHLRNGDVVTVTRLDRLPVASKVNDTEAGSGGVDR